MYVHIHTLKVCIWGSGGGAIPDLVFVQTHFSSVCAREMGLT